MMTAITKGIKVSVQSKFEGYSSEMKNFVFSYVVTIENNSPLYRTTPAPSLVYF